MKAQNMNDPTTFADKKWYTVLVSRAVDTPKIVQVVDKGKDGTEEYRTVPYITSNQAEAETFAEEGRLQFPTYQYTVVQLVPVSDEPSVTDCLVLEITNTFPAGEAPAPEPAPK